MKLGKQTNSLTNNVLSRSTKGQPNPEVGMGATILCWTDRHAGTIIKVETWRKGTLITIQEDKATRTDRNGMSENQDYKYEQDENGRLSRFWFGPESKTWREVVKDADKLKFSPKGSGSGLWLGVRESYHDYSY